MSGGEACPHWFTEPDGLVLVCVECGARLPVGWHDMDEDERAEVEL